MFVVIKTYSNRYRHSPPLLKLSKFESEMKNIGRPLEWGIANKQRKIDGIFKRKNV